jgi:hypothetical protein
MSRNGDDGHCNMQDEEKVERIPKPISQESAAVYPED